MDAVGLWEETHTHGKRGNLMDLRLDLMGLSLTGVWTGEAAVLTTHPLLCLGQRDRLTKEDQWMWPYSVCHVLLESYFLVTDFAFLAFSAAFSFSVDIWVKIQYFQRWSCSSLLLLLLLFFPHRVHATHQPGQVEAVGSAVCGHAGSKHYFLWIQQFGLLANCGL